MFVVRHNEKHVLVSDEIVDAPFCCNLGACLGACCVQGDSGAPLEAEERETIEALLPILWNDLRPEAQQAIERNGAWEEVGKSEYATTCVEDAECVFVTYDGPVAKCALQKAYAAGRTDFPKPISCHLFPLRIESLGEVDALNYEQVPLCKSAIRQGRRAEVRLSTFLREPLVRKYGEGWYQAFSDACASRREALNPSPA